VLMLEIGADDYVTKPYRSENSSLVFARCCAVERRTRASDVGRRDRAGSDRMDIDARRCFVNGEEIKLRKKEFALLRLLLENPDGY